MLRIMAKKNTCVYYLSDKEYKIFGFVVYRRNPRRYVLREISPVFVWKTAKIWTYFVTDIKNDDYCTWDIYPELSEKKEEKIDYEAIVNRVIEVCKWGIVSMNGKPFNVDAFLDEAKGDEDWFNSRMDQLWSIFMIIRAMTFKVFHPEMEIKESLVEHIHSVANTYGATPIQAMFPTGGYSDFESMMFNNFVLSIASKKAENNG